MSGLTEIFLQTAGIEALSGNEKPVADFIKEFLKKNGYDCSVDNSSKFSGSNTGNVICKINSGGDFLVLSHMDTARSTKNVKPVISGGKIMSGGDTVLGVDNRAGIAILLYVLEKIKTDNLPVKDFTAAFTTCEETTLAGSKYLEVSSSIKKGFIFDSSYRPGNFISSACGAMGYKALVKGKASHSGLAPEKGINSIAAAARALSLVRHGRLDDETTSNIAKISGGSAINVVPEETVIEGEVRSFNKKKAEDEINNIHSAFKTETQKANAGLEFDYFWDFEPFILSQDDDVYKNISYAINCSGLNPVPVSSLGGSDANSLNARGIPSVNIGIGAQNPHSNDEFIFTDDLYKSAEIAFQLIKK
jgi:tripeptide aminopeptidase